jgi:ubiquinone/menaquinone biosynthesis C-methylase UbiE
MKNKNFYRNYHDKIFDKRVNSEFYVRRLVHHDMYAGILENIKNAELLLDVGCGECALSAILSGKVNKIVSIDYSKKNIEEAKVRLAKLNISNVLISEGDAENIKFPDNYFDIVVSNHVLEHLPNFQKGLNEIYRVTSNEAIIAVPTCFNFCSLCLLGGVPYYQISFRSIYGIFYGTIRVIKALITGEEGVNEGYGINREQIHIFRFPWTIKNYIEKSGFVIKKIQAQSIRIPFIGLSLNFLRNFPLFKYFGMGTIYLLQK